jgi:hypothetical protein
MGNRQNLPHHGNLKAKPDTTSRNQFTEKPLRDPNNQFTNVLSLNMAAINASQNIRTFTNRDLSIVRVAAIRGASLDFASGVSMTLPPPDAPSSLQGFGGTNYWKPFDQVFIGNEVYVFGYPNSLGDDDRSQLDYTRPLLRRGCLAGRNIANRTLIIDAAMFGGNSGGPVLEYDRQFTRTDWPIIGVVTQFVPFIDQREVNGYSHEVSKRYSNSGYAVVEPIDFVFELIADWEKHQPAKL